MFIYATPRAVFSGFDTFVPTRRVESLQYRLVEMTNNDINAWGAIRPVSTTQEDWEEQHDAISDAENFDDNFAPHFRSSYPVIERQAGKVTKPLADNLSQGQSPSQTKTLITQPVNQNLISEMDCFDSDGPTPLGGRYSAWDSAHTGNSLTQLSGNTSSIDDFGFDNPAQPTSASYTPDIQGIYATSLKEDCFRVETPDSHNEQITTTFQAANHRSDYTCLPGSAPQQRIVGRKPDWWASDSPNYGPIGQAESSLVYDGLPRFSNEQYHLGELWNIESNVCISSLSTPSTISPKDLTLNTSLASTSSQGSAQEPLVYLSDSSVISSAQGDSFECPQSEHHALLEQPLVQQRHRQMLPAAPSIPRRVVPALPNRSVASSEGNKRRFSKPRPVKQLGNWSMANSSAVELRKTTTVPKQKVIVPKAAQSITTYSDMFQSTTQQAEHHRNAKDDFLVRSKLAGMSYKEIRVKGRFTEAESTLRGRFRTLTKHKAARVRKPEWEENDIKLLKKAVRKLSESNKCRIPWKQVAEYIADNGGSYHFGNATCRKRWDELHLSSSC